MTRLLKGKDVALAINQKSKDMIERLRQHNIEPTLAIFRIGEKESDISYEKGAKKRGFSSRFIKSQLCNAFCAK